MVSSATGKPEVVVSATGTLSNYKYVQAATKKKAAHNPLSKPFSMGEHGLARVDCVAVWFFCIKVNRTTSPTLALYTSVEYGGRTTKIDRDVPPNLD